MIENASDRPHAGNRATLAPNSLKSAAAIAVVLLTLGSAEGAKALKPSTSDLDRDFVRAAALTSAVEVAEAKLALTNSKRGDVHDFAQGLLDERAAMDAQLRQVASDDGIETPDGLSMDDQQRIDRLSRLEGPAFERQYVAEASNALWHEVMSSSTESKAGANPGLQFLATQELPLLLGDQRMIEQIAAGATVGVTPPPAPLGWRYQPPPFSP